MKHSILKVTLCTVIILVVLVVSIGCTASESQEATETQESVQTDEVMQTQEQTQTPEETEPKMLSLTIEELSEFDGQDGRPAYIAVDGIIYDVSIIAAWMGGKHKEYFAGQDITEPIKSISPHGVSVLSNLPEVGTLVE
jgi:predicted heme/steroid binding protein